MKQIKTRLLLIPAIFALSACSMMPSAKNHKDDIVFPESIEVVDVNNVAMLTTDVLDSETGEVLYEYYFTHKKSDPTPAMYLQAVISPKGCSYPEVRVVKDEQNISFEIIPLVEEQYLGKNMFVVRPTSPMGQGVLLSAAFVVESTNPGEKISSRVCVAFYRNAYN